MSKEMAEVRLLANTLYEIRVLLGSYLGSENEAPMNVRVAAHIAYALHDEALAVAAGENFDLAVALKKVEAIDSILPVTGGARLARGV